MKCCICGTVRECGKYLKDVFSNMEQLGKLFDDYVIILLLFYYTLYYTLHIIIYLQKD